MGYYTVTKHCGHLRTLKKCRNTHLRLVCSTFPSCSQMPSMVLLGHKTGSYKQQHNSLIKRVDLKFSTPCHKGYWEILLCNRLHHTWSVLSQCNTWLRLLYLLIEKYIYLAKPYSTALGPDYSNPR